MTKNKKSLYDYLKEIEDFRRKEGKRHDLPIVLIIVLMAVMSGFTGERAMGDFVQKNKADLIKYLHPKKWRLPSYQTIDTILTMLWYEKIIDKFMERIANESVINEEDQVALDWKVMRWTGSKKDANNSRQKFVSVISAFLIEKKKVLWTKNINSGKESEIPAVKKLIVMLWLEWVVFTADALHCQKETLKTIINSKNHYVIWVKGNQMNLEKAIKKQTKKKALDKKKYKKSIEEEKKKDL